MRGARNTIALAMLLLPLVVRASAPSERLSASGVAELRNGRNERALELFEQAVQADASDPFALYHRAVTRARLGDSAGAIADLRTTLQLRPDFSRAALDLGVALSEGGADGEAVTWLQQAAADPALTPEASLFLGVASLRLERLEEARRNLQRAAEKSELQASARYYLGVTEYSAENWSAAEQQFALVAAADPDSAMGREAKSFLDRLGKSERAFQVHGAVGLEYDSNVVLAPASDVLKSALDISDESDGRVALGAGASFIPWQNDKLRFSIGYDFFQSLHFQLDEFNLQDHRPTAQISADFDYVVLGLQGQYDYFFLQDDSFLQQGIALPWLTIPEGDWGQADIYYRLRRTDFLKRPFSGTRDAFNHSTGIQQLFNLGNTNRWVLVGYRFDHEDPVNDDVTSESFGYDGHELEIGGGFELPMSFGAEFSYSCRRESYDRAASGDRLDKEHLVSAVLRRTMNDYLTVAAGYTGNFNNSSIAAFEYDRHIASIALEARY